MDTPILSAIIGGGIALVSMVSAQYINWRREIANRSFDLKKSHARWMRETGKIHIEELLTTIVEWGAEDWDVSYPEGRRRYENAIVNGTKVVELISLYINPKYYSELYELVDECIRSRRSACNHDDHAERGRSQNKFAKSKGKIRMILHGVLFEP